MTEQTRWRTSVDLVVRGYRRSTSWLRPLPGILVVGAMRGGTTSLYRALRKHPEINASSRKEIHFMDLHFHRGLGWYRSFFDIDRGIGIDNTPSYLVHSYSALRASQAIPNARILALLRDPAERAWSHYRYRYAGKLQANELQRLIENDLANPPPPMLDYTRLGEVPVLSGGFYAAQLIPWIQLFGLERIRIVDSQKLFDSPNDELQKIQEFLGCVRCDLPFPQVNVAASLETTPLLSTLKEFYAESDRRLVDLVGERFSWMSSQ